MYEVCLRTGDSGRDATALYRDPYLLGHVYAGPYPVADPGLTFVLADHLGVAGYVVATADTTAFERWLEANWWPVLRAQYPRSQAADPGNGTHDWQRVAHLHDAAVVDDELYERYPAHLHIDLLPRAQGAGAGRRLMETLLAALRERGVPGVHLGVGSGNPGARAFYLRIGLQRGARGRLGLDHGAGLATVIRPRNRLQHSARCCRRVACIVLESLWLRRTC